MDVVLSALLFGVICVILWKLITLIRNYHFMCSQLRKLPHPPVHWLYGNLTQVYDSMSYFDTVNTLIKDEKARMFSLWCGPFPGIGLCHPETVKQFINLENRKAKKYTDGYNFLANIIGDGLLISDGKKWDRNRKLLTPAFHFDILRGYIASMNKVSSIFLNKLEQAGRHGKSFDVFPLAGKAALDVMLRCSLSYEGAETIQENEDVPYIKAFRRLSELVWMRCLNPMYMFDTIYYLTSSGREEKKLIKIVQSFTGEIINEKRQKLEANQEPVKKGRHLDFLDILLTAKDADGIGLTAQEIQDEVDTFTFEGHDTTASAISWSIHALGKYPDIQAKVYQDVCQVMGDNSEVQIPVPNISRRHTKPVWIDGIEIPPGARVDINIYAMHHNEDVWPNHHIFDPDRFNDLQRDESNLYGFIPFSAGSRNCIGQNFALNEVKITIAKVVKRFEFSVENLEEPVLLPDIIMRSVNGVQIKLKERK